jgi:hypothetical protein
MEQKNFKTFLKGLKTTNNASLVEAIATGYKAIYETGEYLNQEDMFSGWKDDRGRIVFKPEDKIPDAGGGGGAGHGGDTRPGSVIVMGRDGKMYVAAFYHSGGTPMTISLADDRAMKRFKQVDIMTAEEYDRWEYPWNDDEPLTESEDDRESFTKTVSFEYRNTEGSIDRILELYKAGKKGVMLLDPDGDMDEPVTAFIRSGNYTFSVTDIEDEDSKSSKRCEITTENSSKRWLDAKANSIKDLFEKIAGLGNCGHSYSMKFVPVNNQAKIKEIGWDGDGSDYIDTDSIKIK